jgi:hypothetical protein
MGFMRKMARKNAPQGSIILPRQVAGGVTNWPKCMLCKVPVSAYGLENDTDYQVEIWARCDGLQQSIVTGEWCQVHPVLKSSCVIEKQRGWSQNRLTDIIPRLAFFAPDALSEGRDFTQTLDADGVVKN